MFKMRLEIERGKDLHFPPTTMTVFVFITKELGGQRAPFLPNMMNGFFINHNEPDDGPKDFLPAVPGSGGGGGGGSGSRFGAVLGPVLAVLYQRKLIVKSIFWRSQRRSLNPKG